MSDSEIREFVDAEPGQSQVRGFLHTPGNASGEGLVLTHGAGANCQAPLLGALATAFCETGITVLRCDLPFRQLRPHGPPPFGSAARDRQGLRRAVAVMKELVPGRVFAGGHSYGGRQFSMLAAETNDIPALLLLSYPLHPPNKPDTMRTTHFSQLRTPALFVSGVRDGFSTPEEMTAALKLIPARTELLSIEGAGHELMSKRNSAKLPGIVVQAFTEFCELGRKVG